MFLNVTSNSRRHIGKGRLIPTELTWIQSTPFILLITKTNILTGSVKDFAVLLVSARLIRPDSVTLDTTPIYY